MNPIKLPSGDGNRCVICRHLNTNNGGVCCRRCDTEYETVIALCGLATARVMHMAKYPKDNPDVIELVATG